MPEEHESVKSDDASEVSPVVFHKGNDDEDDPYDFRPRRVEEKSPKEEASSATGHAEGSSREVTSTSSQASQEASANAAKVVKQPSSSQTSPGKSAQPAQAQTQKSSSQSAGK